MHVLEETEDISTQTGSGSKNNECGHPQSGDI